MHAIFVSDYGHISGGAAQVAITSARALADRGTRVTFACALGPASAELDHAGITVHCLEASNVWSVRRRWQAAAQGIWNAAAGRWLKGLLRDCDPRDTVVHIHQWTKAFSPSVLAAAAASGLPVVVSLHDYFLSCPNGAYFMFPQQRPCTLRPMSMGCVVADCDSRSRGHKVVRLLRQAVTGAVVCVGRITVEKGCVVLARAAALAGVPLVVMGEGPALQQMRHACPDMEVRPWGDQAAVEHCFSQARVLALPSLWYETGGLVVQEGLARGVPAIVSTISGAAEVVGDACGLRVPPGDVEALAAALRTLDDDALVQRMSENAYRAMREGPQRPGAHADGLLAIYQTLVAGHAMHAA